MLQNWQSGMRPTPPTEIGTQDWREKMQGTQVRGGQLPSAALTVLPDVAMQSSQGQLSSHTSSRNELYLGIRLPSGL